MKHLEHLLHIFQLFVALGASLVYSLNCGPPPFLREARLIGVRNQTYPVGTSLSYECNLGYTKSSEELKARCISDDDTATWHVNVNCSGVSCGAPGEIENGIVLGNDWTHPNSVEFLCNEGYILNSDEKPFFRHCQANQQWSNHLPSCLIVNCSIPENAEYAATVFFDVSYGSKVIYDCGPGRRIDGSAVRECLSNGEWTGTTPKCVEIECENPNETYPHGQIHMLAGTRQNDKIEYQCNNGTVITATCVQQGVWSPPPPLCLTGYTSGTTENPLLTTGPTTTESPKKRHTICRWRILRWICTLIYRR